MTSMKAHVAIEEFKRVIWDTIQQAGVPNSEFIDDDDLAVLAHLLNNINSRLMEMDSDKDKIIYLRKLCLNIAAADMSMTKKLLSEQ